MSSANLHAPFAPTPRRSHVTFVASLRRTAALLKEAGIRWADDACIGWGPPLPLPQSLALPASSPCRDGIRLLSRIQSGNPRAAPRLGRQCDVASAPHPSRRHPREHAIASDRARRRRRRRGHCLIFGASGAFSDWRRPSTPSGASSRHPRPGSGKASSSARGQGNFARGRRGERALLLSSFLVSTILGAATEPYDGVIAEPFAWKAIDAVAVSLVFATIIFAVIFRLLPRTKVTWRDVLGGRTSLPSSSLS